MIVGPYYTELFMRTGFCRTGKKSSTSVRLRFEYFINLVVSTISGMIRDGIVVSVGNFLFIGFFLGGGSVEP